MMRFFEVLPTQLKSEIAELATKEAGRVGLKSIPAIGNIISGVSAVFSGKDMVQTFMDPNKDTLDKVLATAQFGLDVAGVFPAVNSFTGPAGLVLQMARMFKSGHDIIRDFHKYQTSMADLTLPSQPNQQVPIIAKLVEVGGTYGQSWHLRTAAAFVAMVVPLLVFFALQRYFVRGLLAGAVKG